MTINRHNYEEFFLLYTDGELDAEGKKMVEDFASLHPDLAPELSLLRHTKLHDQPLAFNLKQLLYKHEEGITPFNYEEYFMLYHDGELTAASAAEVEQFVLKHPQFQPSFLSFQRSTLKGETITCPRKEKLYRQKNKHRVIWMRLSAAAAITALIAGTYLLNLNQENIQGSLAIAPLKKAPSSVNTQPLKATGQTGTRTGNITPIEARDLVNAAAGKKALTFTAGNVTKPSKRATVVLKQKDNFSETTSAITLKDPEGDMRLALLPEKETPFQQQLPLAKAPGKPGKTLAFAPQKDQQANIIPTVYSIIDNAEDENGIYIGSAEINKRKLKGFLKKAVGFLDKKAAKNNEDNVIQVASFQIKG